MPTSHRYRRSQTLLFVFACLWALLGVTNTTHAQAADPLAVLGLTSVDGDDDLARTLTDSLRATISQRPRVRLDSSDAVLAQIELAVGCEAPELSCLSQIAEAVGVRYLIFGYIHRSGPGASFSFEVAMSLYDRTTNSIEQETTASFPNNHVDIDDLRTPSHAIAEGLLGHGMSVGTGTLRVVGDPNAPVRVDGSVVGETDATGGFVGLIPAGVHSVEVGSSPSQSVTITEGADAQVSLAQTPRSNGNETLQWASYGLLGLGGASLIATGVFGALLMIQQSNLDPYRVARPVFDSQGNQTSWAYNLDVGVGGMPQPVSGMYAVNETICNQVQASGPLRRIADECSGTNEASFWTFAGLTVASSVAGFALLSISSGSSNSETSAMLIPSITPQGVTLTAVGTF